jgi:beta-galactosidase
MVDAWAQHTFQAETSIRDPQLWSIENPNLYRAVVTVHSSGVVVDADQTTFGVRTLHFDADEGFFLNGRHVKIKGTCCHQDHAGVGAALPDRLQYYRIERLKSMGSNALRTSHNPPTPALMDATDRLGMLVLCETRMMDSSPEGLSQLERMVRRFRNHPSIFMWSLGNEEPEEGTDRGIRILTTMKRLAHELDPTRLCTFAQNEDFGIGISRVVDVQGFNYNENLVDKFHRDFPHQPCMGTEGNGAACTRGIYEDDKTAGYVSAYDVTAPPWASTAQKWWSFYDERPFLAGAFSWTGFDYRGEPWPYAWPCVSSQYGIMDNCGFPKDNYYYFKAWWGAEPVLHLFPHWNWPESKRGEEISVWCHTNLESVELFLNGASQGTQKVVRNQHVEWKVKYQPGVIEARGTKDGKVVLTAKRETTGEPARISLHPDRTEISADGEDVSVITVEIQDAQGRSVPVAQKAVAIQVSGGGKLLGLGNGDPSSHESDKADHRRVFNGCAQAIVQSSREPGTITVEATSPGLEGSTVTIASIASTPRPSV